MRARSTPISARRCRPVTFRTRSPTSRSPPARSVSRSRSRRDGPGRCRARAVTFTDKLNRVRVFSALASLPAVRDARALTVVGQRRQVGRATRAPLCARSGLDLVAPDSGRPGLLAGFPERLSARARPRGGGAGVGQLVRAACPGAGLDRTRAARLPRCSLLARVRPWHSQPDAAPAGRGVVPDGGGRYGTSTAAACPGGRARRADRRLRGLHVGVRRDLQRAGRSRLASDQRR